MNLQIFIRSLLFASTIVLFSACNNSNNTTTTETKTDPFTALRKILKDSIATKNAKIGLSLLNIETGDTLNINNDTLFAMQSTYKVPLSVVVLQLIEQGKLQLQQKTTIDEAIAKRYNWSPLKQQNPGKKLALTLDSLMMYAVSYSDNLACDKLFEVIGGTAVADSAMQARGYNDMHIKYTEHEIGEEVTRMYVNNCRPSTMCLFLRDLYQQKLLNEKNTTYILDKMLNDSTSHKRLYGQLAPGIRIAHKTGSGIKVVNDIGIVYLPNGQHLAISVFIMHAEFEYEEAERIVAVLGKACVEFYTK